MIKIIALSSVFVGSLWCMEANDLMRSAQQNEQQRNVLTRSTASVSIRLSVDETLSDFAEAARLIEFRKNFEKLGGDFFDQVYKDRYPVEAATNTLLGALKLEMAYLDKELEK